MTTKQFKQALRDGPHAWPGGYPKFFVMSDGGALSFESAKKNARLIIQAIREKSRDGWRAVACEINWEDASLYCDDSGERIESAYAEEQAAEC